MITLKAKVIIATSIIFLAFPLLAAHRPCQNLQGVVVCDPVDLSCHSNSEGGGKICPNYEGDGCQILQGVQICPNLDPGCKVFDGQPVCPDDGCHFNKNGKEVCKN